MTDRLTVDQITSDQLDELYDRIETLEHVAAGNKRHVQLIVPDLERAETRLAKAADVIADHEGDEWAAHPATTALRAALDRPRPDKAGAHVYLSTGCRHDNHAYCKSMTGQAGAKRPGECKHCGAKCICPCHTDQPKEQ